MVFVLLRLDWCCLPQASALSLEKHHILKASPDTSTERLPIEVPTGSLYLQGFLQAHTE